MRGVLTALAFASVILLVPHRGLAQSDHPVAVATIAALQAADAQGQAPAKDLNVDINVNHGGSGGYAWYRSPVWIAIGALAFIVLLMVIIFAARGGGGPTVIRS